MPETTPTQTPPVENNLSPLVLTADGGDPRLNSIAEKDPALREKLLSFLNPSVSLEHSPTGFLKRIEIVSWVQVPQALALLKGTADSTEIKIVFPETTADGVKLTPQVVKEQEGIHKFLSNAHKKSASDLSRDIKSKIATCEIFRASLGEDAYKPREGGKGPIGPIIHHLVNPWLKEVEFDGRDTTVLNITHLHDAQSVVDAWVGNSERTENITPEKLPDFLIGRLAHADKQGGIILQINTEAILTNEAFTKLVTLLNEQGPTSASLIKVWVGPSREVTSGSQPPLELSGEGYLKWLREQLERNGASVSNEDEAIEPEEVDLPPSPDAPTPSDSGS